MKYIAGLVSVVMPTYKRSDMLSRAVESVLGQTYPHIELLLVNDNEVGDEYTSELCQRVKKFESDSRFHLIMQEKHINGAVARNVGIRQAKGEYIAFLDDDDWWKPNKIEEQVNVLSGLDSTWGGVSCRIEQYDGDTLIYSLPKYDDGYVYKDVLMLKCDLATSTLLLRHEALDAAGYFDQNLLRHQDLQLLVDFSSKYKVMQLDAFLHCCDVSDTANRPNGDKLLGHKQRFFASVEPVMSKMSKAERRCIFAVHNFEVGYVYLKERRWLKGITYCCKVLTSFQAVRLTVIKTVNKLKSKT